MQSAEELESTVTHVVEGDEPAILARIFEPGVNLVVFRRSIDSGLQAFTDQYLLRHAPCAEERALSRAEDVAGVLPASILASDGVAALQADIEAVARLWQDLFDPDRSGVRFRILDKAMCPRFHVDRVMVRLIVSYGGSGTEWLPEEAVDRSLLGMPLTDPNQDPLARPEAICPVPSYAIALLKGSAWPGNEDRAIVHRSPHIHPPERRALLTLDMLA
jgi:hypothetical protein